MTRGYLRLRELPGLGLPITEYPLPEVRARWQGPDRAEAAGTERPASESTGRRRDDR